VNHQRHTPSTLSPGERHHNTHLTGCWVGPRCSLGTVVERKLYTARHHLWTSRP